MLTEFILLLHLGCHEDMNCAAETGSPAKDVYECCARRNMRSYRNPLDGTCQNCSQSNVHNYNTR